MPEVIRDFGSSIAVTAFFADICFFSLYVPDWMFLPRGLSFAAFTNAFVLFTTSESTRALPISVRVEFFSIVT